MVLRVNGYVLELLNLTHCKSYKLVFQIILTDDKPKAELKIPKILLSNTKICNRKNNCI